MNALANTAPIAANDQAMTSTEQRRLECEARYWIAAAKAQGVGWRVWLRDKLQRIEETRKHPLPELRAEINRQVEMAGKNA